MIKKLKVSTVDIQINRLVLRVSNSKVISSGLKSVLLVQKKSVSYSPLQSANPSFKIFKTTHFLVLKVPVINLFIVVLLPLNCCIMSFKYSFSKLHAMICHAIYIYLVFLCKSQFYLDLYRISKNKFGHNLVVTNE